MNALASYNRGATGAGIGIAIIDSGIDLQSEEFAGRLSPASQDVAGNASVDDEGGHGTAVAFTAAGRRNAAGSHGVAYGATVIALRADRAGSCAMPSTEGAEDSCRFGTDAIARGVDAARVAGARVINMSLGGSQMPTALVAAIDRATAAGIVVIIAAGNDGLAEPDAFAAVASNTGAARNQVIIAGSVGASDGISSFSDRAGSQANVFLTAVGERVRAPDETGTPFLWSGTSFAAPQIAGAVALLAQAFPNLSGAQIVQLLYASARDAGAPGVDPIYGRGVIDLTRAFQPIGASVVAGTTMAVSTRSNGTLSAPMGDARGALGAVILDGFDRAFAIDLAGTLARAERQPLLNPALRQGGRTVAFQAGSTAVSMTLASNGRGVALDRTMLTPADATAARAVAGSVVQRVGSKASFAMGFAQGAGALVAAMAGTTEPAFLVAQSGGLGIPSAARTSSAFRHSLGRWGLTGAVERGDVFAGVDPLSPARQGWRRFGYDRAALTLDRRFGDLATSVTAARMDERDTVLGARLGAGLGSPNAASWFVDGTARWTNAAGWTLGGSWRQGWSALSVRGIEGGGRLRTTAFSADLGKDGVWGRDSIGLRIAQPLRVASGGLALSLPTAWDYASGSVGARTAQTLALAPAGRELDVEARYALQLGGGWLQTNAYWRRDPGNVAALPDDYGVALRWGTGF
jgi:hypothetical protein